MTDDATRALAAALHNARGAGKDCWEPGTVRLLLPQGHGPSAHTSGPDGAEAIIAALAAAGWRITSAPEPDDPNECRMTGRHYCEPGTYHTDRIRMTYRAAEPIVIESQDDPAPDNHLTTYLEGRDDIDRATYSSLLAMGKDDERAAVRAALEGLRAEVVAMDPVHVDHDWLRQSAILAIIDARLAALDE